MFLRFTFILFSISVLFFTESAFAWKMEAEKVTVNNTNGNVSTHINFRQSYNSIPLVFTLATDSGGDSATLRVNNVTTTGFDIYIVEPDGNDGPHIRMTSVPYIAIEAGSHVLPDGTKIVAGTTNTNSFQSKLIAGSSWQTVGLSGFATTPVILGQIQTQANERTDLAVPSAVSQPWITTVISNVSSTSFDIALERSETTSGSMASNETIAYLAIDSGLNNGNHYFGDNIANKIEYETILSSRSISGWSNTTTGNTINFSKSYTNPIAVSTKNTRYGWDGGWLRRRSILTSSIALTVDEDVATDAERSHTTEAAGILLFSEPFDAEFIYSGQASLVINEVMYKESVTGSTNDEFIELYVTAGGNLNGMILSDQDTHFFRFPSQFVSTGDYVIYHTGVDPGGTPVVAGVYHFYQGISTVWNNTEDDVLLIKPSNDVTITTNGTVSTRKVFNGVPIDYVAYGASSVTGGIDAIPTSMHGTTVSWNYTFGTELRNAVAGESISLTPNANDSNQAGCWELTTSGNASNNGCTGYLPTQTTAAGSINSMGNNNNTVPKITLAKSLLTIYDPYNGASNPKAIPGAIIEYIINAKNDGALATDNNSVFIADAIPTNTKVCVSTTVAGCLAPYFVDGSPSSGLSLASVVYSNDNGTTFAYTPVADAEGTDSNITNLRASMSGAFLPKTGATAPNFQLKFRIIVK